MAHLTKADKDYFKEQGYVVIRDALHPQVIDAALEVIWNNVEADRNVPDSWIDKGYQAFDIGGTDALKRTIYTEPVFAMAEEMVGKGTLNTDGGVTPHLNFPAPNSEWHPPTGHLDGYYTPSNGVPKGGVSVFTLGVTIYLGRVESKGGGFMVWPKSHKIFAEYFRHHDIDSLEGGVAPFDLGVGVEVTGGPGDICFWHNQLSHTASTNISRDVRIALIGRVSRKDLDQIKYETPQDMWKYWEGIN